MTCGVYLLRFKNTDKVYIGISENIEKRWSSHKYSIKNRLWPDKLQGAYDKYGLPNLEIICECTKEELEINEREAIEIFNSLHNGFNSRDAGSCGAGLSISGESNGRAVYSNRQIEDVFNLLVDTLLTHKEISDKTGVSIQAISHISAGTAHAWLASIYPEKYMELVSKKRVTKNIFVPVNILNTTTGSLTRVSSYKEIQELTTCAYTTAVAFISGKVKTIYDIWKLEKPVTANKAKKPVYTMQHQETGEIVQVYSKLDFFNSKKLVNRKKLTYFFKEAVLDSVYQDWRLVSISHDNLFT